MNSDVQLFVLAEVIIAAILGGVIGFEREVANKPAGFRTHILVAASSALLVGIAQILISSFDRVTNANIVSDPVRIIEAITVGVSFIGGGIIIKDSKNSSVSNLTTAASVLLSVAVGVCCALEQFILAIGVTVFVVIINRFLLRFDRKIQLINEQTETT